MALEKYSYKEIPSSTKFNAMVTQVNTNTEEIGSLETRIKAIEDALGGKTLITSN